MDISVIVCTWNNSDTLRQTLLDISRCRIPKGVSWELLAVDNNSTDDTRPVVESMTDVLPVRYFFEPRQGLSCARNCGVQSASGELIIFTDDDIIPNSEWIAVYWDAFQANPDGMFWGGCVESNFVGGEPDWDVVRLGPPSIRGLDLGPTSRIIDGDIVPFIAANWAVARRAVVAVGGFNPDLGLNSANGTAAVGEETDLMQRLVRYGLAPCYLPAAKIRHIVPVRKVSVDHLARRRYEAGRYVAASSSPPARQILRIPPWALRQLLTSTKRWLLAKASRRRGLDEYLEVQWSSGLVSGFRQRSARPRTRN